MAICTSDRRFAPCACPDASSPPNSDAGTQASGGAGGTLATGGADAGVIGGAGGTGNPGSGGSITGTGGVAGAVGAVEVRSLEIAARHLVADKARGRVYVSVAGAAANYPNSLVVIDVATASVATSVSIGSDPNSLAISDDGTTLWVGIDGSFSLRKVDLTSGTPVPGATYSLPRGDFNDLAAAGPMVVLPGGATSLAVSLHRFGVSPSFSGAVVIDDGIARTRKTPGHTGASKLTAGPPGFVFGFNNLHTGFGFYTMKVSATGLDQTEQRDLVNGFATDISYADGRVYATSGEVVDVSSPDKPSAAGKFSFQGLILPRANLRVLMLSPIDRFSGGARQTTMRMLDGMTFTQVSSHPVSGVAEESLGDLVHAGDDRVAFIGLADRFSSTSSTSKVYVVRTPLLR